MNVEKLGYNKAKEKAKKLYSDIGAVRCPALGDEYVFFSSLGFNHLIRKGRIPRSRNEQKRRFTLLLHVEKIIKSPKAVIIYRKENVKEKSNRHGEKILIESVAHFWALIEKIEDCEVKVIVRQLKDGNKHFFSVMGDNVKILKTKNPRNREF
ncbi:MAG: hypothetical protein WC319_05720 [Candidatus Paceibacterota bacterium]|jgi:hypothetical protein